MNAPVSGHVYPLAACGLIIGFCAAVLGGYYPAEQQGYYLSGQNVAPVFEGWQENDDGSFTMLFGYLNRNLDEELDIPIGPNNRLEPGGLDQGQPTHFLPNRNQFVFGVKVPPDFGNRELVWTVTAHRKTARAFATLKPDYVIDDVVRMMNTARWGDRENVGARNTEPVLTLEGSHEVKTSVGRPVTLKVLVSDDGIPKASPAADLMQPNPTRVSITRRSTTPGRYGALGLRVAWFVYRGVAKHVKFDPPQFKVYKDTRGGSPWSPGWMAPPIPSDGRVAVTADFTAPGVYVLRCLAHDGVLGVSKDVTVIAGS